MPDRPQPDRRRRTRVTRFDYSPPRYTGPTAEEIVRKRKEFLSRLCSTLYKKPLNIVHGKMQYLFDENGRRIPWMDLEELLQ
ncbi:putative alanine--glyoxylate transaminase [Helianthus annuus]|nr:putative alanine--glyoxylate transaminase [Helianthus annuus]